MPQLVHELPPVPQPVAGLLSLGVQLEPVQQPSQVCAQPRQAPVGEQVLPGSAPPLVQSTQLPPLVPHCVFDGVTHTVPLQQPLAHEVASQTQLPPTQCWPAPQAAPLPHMQVPPTQLSALMPQLVVAEHEPPPGPQCVVSMRAQPVPVSHWLAEQPQLAPRQT